MARKVLGQLAPAATTNTDIYTVPASTEAVVSTFLVCNRSSSPVKFRVAVRPGGASIANQHYNYYDLECPANETFAATLGITLATTDVITVYAETADLSFSLYGSEISTA